MRLPNFVSTVSNRASLSITQTLYDRRALDCTASRPLVQSLQELVQLTNTSSKVRETLCEDGGLERLVQLIKDAQNPEDKLSPYKWHLCMQCFLNLGARGTPEIRARVIESGVIPVLATLLDNYLIVHGDLLERRDKKHTFEVDSSATQSESNSNEEDQAFSRLQNQQQNNNIENNVQESAEPQGSEPESRGRSGHTGELAGLPLANNLDVETRAQQFIDQINDSNSHEFGPSWASERFATGVEDRIPMRQQAQSDTQPEAQSMESLNQSLPANVTRTISQPNSQVSSNSQNSDGDLDVDVDVETNDAATGGESESMDVDSAPQTGMANEVGIESLFEDLTSISFFNNPSRTLSMDVPNGSILPTFVNNKLCPREQDVCWALEIIAYLSKHAASRKNMQESYFIKKLSFRKPGEIHNSQDVDPEFNNGELGKVFFELPERYTRNMEDWERDYYSYNFMNVVDMCEDHCSRHVKLFELVEKYTTFKSPREFPHWSYIIMRNFIRKDESGIRQCANFNCGKWEEYPRQFAKCRRCRRTKYCSKTCQLRSWTMHRFWCTAAPSSSSSHQHSSRQLRSAADSNNTAQQSESSQNDSENNQMNDNIRPNSGPMARTLPAQGLGLHTTNEAELQDRGRHLERQGRPTQQEVSIPAGGFSNSNIRAQTLALAEAISIARIQPRHQNQMSGDAETDDTDAGSRSVSPEEIELVMRELNESRNSDFHQLIAAIRSTDQNGVPRLSEEVQNELVSLVDHLRHSTHNFVDRERTMFRIANELVHHAPANQEDINPQPQQQTPESNGVFAWDSIQSPLTGTGPAAGTTTGPVQPTPHDLRYINDINTILGHIPTNNMDAENNAATQEGMVNFLALNGIAPPNFPANRDFLLNARGSPAVTPAAVDLETPNEIEIDDQPSTEASRRSSFDL